MVKLLAGPRPASSEGSREEASSWLLVVASDFCCFLFGDHNTQLFPSVVMWALSLCVSLYVLSSFYKDISH